ncbi:MAG TPA: hypothetical protein VH683_06375 [Thermoleophilaceae bacterium]|jgi:hypothetical protein
MRRVCFGVVAVSVALTMLTAGPAAAQARHSCGNFGTPAGHEDEPPVFTEEQVVGAAVEDIRTREIGCRKARKMVRAFWNGRFNCNESGLRCRYFSYRCRNRRLGDELWLMRCFSSVDRDKMLKFRFGA